LLGLLGISLSYERVIASVSVFALFVLSVLSLAFLLSMAVEGFWVRVQSRGFRVELSSRALTLHQAGAPVVLDFAAPLQCELWRSEGDHKERGGLVRILLSQQGRAVLLLGALPRAEHDKPDEALSAVLSRAEEHPFLDFSREEQRPDARLLPKEGDIAQVLLALPAESLPPLRSA
jgi:hypothetical protein